MIEVSHLSKSYGSRPAVQDLSFTVPDGQIYGLLGPNGAGKSTIMNILTGYLAPTEGEVKVAGFRLPEQAQQAKACVGYLPEQPPLYPEMTVQEYLDFVAELKGVKRAQRKQQVLAAARRTGLEEVLLRVIRSLSKGYRQRVGIAQALKSAMQQYTNRDRRRFGDPDIAKTALVKWKEEMEICRDQLHGFDYSGFFEQDNSKRALAITSGANFLSSPAMVQRKKNFMEHSNLLHNATTLCRSLLDEQQKAEVCYMDALRVMMLKLSQKGKISRHEINERIGELLRQSVKTDGVINLFGDRQIEFSLFDDAFIQEVKNMKERNLAVELLTKLMKEKIKQQQKTNVVQSDLFSDMLSQSLSNYLKGLLTNEEVIEELLKMAQQMKQAEAEGNDLGLSPEEKAFYDALSTPEGVRQAYSDEEFVALTRELTEVLHRNRTIDWNRKESARAKMRVMVKRLLKKYKYPPEGAEKALETVMRQCDHWADDEENVV